MTTLIKAVEFANGADCPHAGMHLRSFDFDAHGGLGFGEFTSSRSQAKAFADTAAAFAFWKTVSPRYPVRADGKPNRPLTALSITFVELGEDHG